MSHSPQEMGFFMPAEWAPHQRSWMAWPTRRDLWEDRLHDAQTAYARVAQAIAGFEPVTMIANPEDVAQARAICGEKVEILALPIDDSWMRDSGPTFLINAQGEIAGADWQFNAWGEKFPPWDKDALVASRVLNHLHVPAFQAPFVLEGGSIHADGEGTLITTEQCLLNKNRNPTLSRAEIEENLRAWLGVQKIIWLGEGLENDHTDGHVDDITCFVRPGVVMTAVCNNPNDANYAPLQENLARLRAATDAKGRQLEIIEMPLPAAREIEGVGRLAASYINFYIVNGGIIAPGFDDPMDEKAQKILASAFPDRKLVMVPGLTIVAGGGNVHCITQQQPAGPAARI